MHKLKSKQLIAACVMCMTLASAFPVNMMQVKAAESDKEIVLRVCNWEEYMDLGDWDEEETIDLPDGDVLGVNPMYEDFEEWYYETYGQKVRVEYSCFGTNEELYNMLTLGDQYDIVCPSEYMIMKMMSEDMLVPFSEHFFDESDENNDYIRRVSPFIRDTFENNEIDGEAWSKYAAGYMWGITGILYNPEKVTLEEASTWHIIDNPKFKRQVTIKDNVRDTMFAAVGAIKSDKLTSESFTNEADYHNNLAIEMNDTSDESIDAMREYLQQVKDNVYSFETDSGKADMITGKVAAGYQWSGDAVYAMDQAEEDECYLAFATPVESVNLYFDGWVMLKCGIGEDTKKQHAAEAFVNFLAQPENVVRNMYYIGYTSVIGGGDSNMIYDYLCWNYEAEDDEEDTVEYPLGYFFSGDSEDEDYVITISEEQTRRQLAAQYPTQEIMNRSAIMQFFDAEENAKINQMWIDVRCLNIRKVPIYEWCVIACIVIGAGAIVVKRKKN